MMGRRMTVRDRKLMNPSEEELRAFSLDYLEDVEVFVEGRGHDVGLPLTAAARRGGQKRRHEHD